MPLLSRVSGEVSESAFVEGLVYVCACAPSRVRLFATPWTGVHQAPLSMRFPRQEYWGGLPFPSPGEGLGEQQSTRPDQVLLHPLPPSSLAHSLFLSIQPLSEGHPCHPILRMYPLPVPCPGQLHPTATKDGLKPHNGSLGLASCRRNQKHWILTSFLKKKKKLFILHKK